MKIRRKHLTLQWNSWWQDSPRQLVAHAVALGLQIQPVLELVHRILMDVAST